MTKTQLQETGLDTAVALCFPAGMTSADHDAPSALLCDEYYTWTDEPSGKVPGFVFWFDGSYWPRLYFVPVESHEDLQEALESWIDALYARKACEIIGGGYEGSQSFEEYARECEDSELNGITFGASHYGIESEGWNCRQTWIECDGLDGAERFHENWDSEERNVLE